MIWFIELDLFRFSVGILYLLVKKSVNLQHLGIKALTLNACVKI